MWLLLHHVLVGGRGCPCPPEIKNPLCLWRGLGELHSLEEPVPGQGSALHLCCLLTYGGVRSSIPKNTLLGNFGAGLLQWQTVTWEVCQSSSVLLVPSYSSLP